MKVSIITAVYNRADSIGRTIESVLEQSYGNIEYIIVDGCSSDGTLEIIEKYRDRISCVLSERDNGIYDALNKGIGLASGDIIGFLHSDDFYTNNNVVQGIVDGFKIGKTCDMVYGDLSFFQGEKQLKITRRYSSAFFRPWMMRFALQPAHPTVYVRRDFFKQVGLFNQKYSISADFDWLFRAFWIHGASYRYLKNDMIKMRQGGASTEGIKALIKHNNEDLEILKSHGIRSGWLLIVVKLMYKTFQVRI